MIAHRAAARRVAARLRAVLPLAALLASAPAAAQNLVANPRFDTDTASWSLNDPGSSFAWDSRDAGGSSASGSGHLTHSTLLYYAGAGQCVSPITPGALYDFGAKTFIPSGQSATGSANVLLDWYDAPGCTGNLLGSTGTNGNLGFDVWTPSSRTGMPAPAGARSALLTVNVAKSTSPAPFEVFFDDATLQLTGTPVVLQSFAAE